MNSLIRFLILNSLTLLLLVACQGPQKTPSDAVGKNTHKLIQGVTGKVVFKEGDFTSSGEILRNGKMYGVERMILIYELTNLKNAEIGEGDFVKYVSSDVIDTVYSDKSGNFAKELPEGQYSLFIQESDRLYSKIGDHEYFMPVTVKAGKNELITIEVDYMANYLLKEK